MFEDKEKKSLLSVYIRLGQVFYLLYESFSFIDAKKWLMTYLLVSIMETYGPLKFGIIFCFLAHFLIIRKVKLAKLLIKDEFKLVKFCANSLRPNPRKKRNIITIDFVRSDKFLNS